MLTEVIMPKLGLTMEEGTVQTWRKAEGSSVQHGEVLLDIETDKTVVEVEAAATGYLRSILVAEKTVVPVGTPLAIITTTMDESIARAAVAPVSGSAHAAHAASKPAVAGKQPDAERSDAEVSVGEGAKPKASPAARRRARELEIDLARVKGTGPGGLIGVSDVEGAAVATNAVALTGMRRAVARAMVLSHRTTPVFTLQRKARVSRLIEVHRLRKAALSEAGGPELTITDLLLFSVARALTRHPEVNSSFVGDPDDASAHIVRHAAVNLGLAVATDSGLVVPVMAGAAALSLKEISQRRSELIERARAGRLKADESTGGTFTVSNLGGMGIDSFTAVINPPEAAILAVGRIMEEPVAEAGRIVAAATMSLTLTADHRVLDGAQAAVFLVDLVAALESADDWN